MLRTRAALCLLALLLFATEGRADGPATGAAAGESAAAARVAFRDGESAFETEAYAKALAHFERAFELAPHDAVRFNMAVCLERLGRYAEAAEQYRLASESTLLPEAERARAREAATSARAQLVVIVVVGAAPGTPVIVDEHERCSAPCTLEVDPGRRAVLLGTGEGALRFTLELAPGERRVLEPPPAAPEPEPEPEPRPTPSPKPTRREMMPEPTRATESPNRGPGLLTFGGAGVALVGAGAATYFGVRALDEHGKVHTEEVIERGERFRDYANISIGVAVVGAALVAVDLLIFAPRPEERQARRPGMIHF